MKKALERVTIIVFVFLIIAPSIVWGAIKIFGSDELISKFEYDLNENRNLTEFSFDNMEAYYNDHVPFRSVIIDAHTKLESSIEKPYRTKLQGILAKTFYPNMKSGQTASLIDMLSEEQEAKDTLESMNDMTQVQENTDCNYEIIEEVDASCTEPGYVKKVCTDCGDEVTEVIEALGHNEELLETLEPTYLNYGHTIYRCTVCKNKRWTDFQEKLYDESYLPCVIENNMTVLGRFNWLFYRGNASLNYYRGVNMLSEEEKQSYLNSMQTLQEMCTQQNKKLVFAIFPNKEQVYPEYMPSLDIVNEVKREPDLVDYVKANSEINIIYPLNELMMGKLYYDTYYPYDSHWNNIGAFIGEQEILKALELPTTDFWNLDTELTASTERGLIATGALNEADYTGDFDYCLDYKNDVDIISEETTTNYKQTMISNADNPLKLMIVGDSFRLRTIQYFSKDFSKVTAIHRDDIRQAKDELREADVLLVCCVERFDSEMIKNISTLVSLLK